MLYQTDNPHGGDLYSRPVQLDYSANTNPLGTPESVRQAVIASVDCLNQYPDPFCRELVSAISAFERVDTSYVLCGCGAAELIFSYCTAIHPKKALELAPTFSEYATALEATGCQVERYALSEEKNFVLDASFLELLDSGSWDVLFLCNPNNPTGRVIEPTLLLEILQLCRKKQMRLFVDECFLDLTDLGESHSLKSQLEAFPELFILKAFTKSYGMAGLRLGYCLCSDKELLTAMGKTCQPWNVSTPAQRAGVAALQEVEFLNVTRDLIRKERVWLFDELQKLGIKVFPSQTNYLLFYSPLPLQDKLMEQGIQIRDCSNYHGLQKGWYRIAVKRHEENEQLISALKGVCCG